MPTRAIVCKLHFTEPMPVRLRFSLHGRRNNRIFHLVAIDLRKRRDAKPIELLGVYDPRLRLGHEHKTMHWSVERILYWLEKGGAQPSKSVVKLLEKVCVCCVPVQFACILIDLTQGRNHSSKLEISSRGFIQPFGQFERTLSNGTHAFVTVIARQMLGSRGDYYTKIVSRATHFSVNGLHSTHVSHTRIPP